MTLFRTIKFGGQHFLRNFWLSVATITILMLTLLSGHILLSLSVLGKTAEQNILSRIDMSVHFKPEVSTAAVQNAKSALLNVAEVQDIQYLSPSDSLQKFLALHKNDPIALDALSEAGQNPFGATLVIKARRVEDYPVIVKVLAQPTYAKLIESADYEDRQAMIGRIQTIAARLETFVAGIGVLFLIITLLIVFTTIRVSISIHREEISIMRLVGASNAFIRGQFYVEALLWSLVAIGITTAFLFPALQGIEPFLQRFFGSTDITLLAFYQKNWLVILSLESLGVIALAFFTTKLATNRYVKI